MYQNVYFDIQREFRVEDAVDKSTYYLPKAYTYEGECVNGLPQGKGTIKVKD